MAFEYQGFATLGVNLNRQKYGPLDISNVFTSENDLKYYLSKGAHTEGVSKYWYESADKKVVPYPYEGQVLATVINGVVNVYALALDAEGNFTTQEIAGKIEVDEKTIKLNNDGKLELVGLENIEPGKTYVPSIVNGVLTWDEPDTSTAEGQAQEINALKTRAAALEVTVNGVEASEGVEAKEGLVDKVAANAQAVIDEKTAREAADTVLESKIAEALQAAKDYADANDANTVYDDTALAGRVKAIEDDYLKAEDKYNDTALVNRIAEAEAAISANATAASAAVEAEKTRAEEAEADLLSKINAIDFVDPEELAAAIKDFATTAYVDAEVSAIEDAISKLNHFKAEVVDSVDKVTEAGVLYLIKDADATGVDKYNEYILVGDVATLIGDTTTDLSNYYNKTEVDSKVDSINAAIAEEVEAREALSEDVAALKAVDNATQAELDAYKQEVTTAISDAKQAAIDDADSKLSGKVDTSEFTTFKADNAAAIATAKQEAINAAAAAEEAKGYAVATDVENTYATKAMLEAHEGEITEELANYAKTSEVNAELAKKIETATITHADEDNAEGVTTNGTVLNIVVDAYTKEETLAQIEEILDRINDNSESAASVNTKLENHIKTYTEKVGQLDAKDAEQDTAIAAAQEQANKGVADAKTANDAVVALTNGTVADNTREIGVAKDLINTVNTTLTSKITALEAKDTGFTTSITALETTVGGHTTTITEHGTAIAVLQNKDTELAALIQGNTDKFADYYTSAQVDAKVSELSEAVGDIDLTPFAKSEDVNAALALKANAADVYTKEAADAAFMTQDEVDSRINALIVAADPEGGKAITDIQNLVKYVDENAGEIAALVTTTEANAAKLAGISSTVTDYVASQIATIVVPKASTEITVATDGTLGIGEVSTDKLVQGTMTLVLNGGNAEVSATN